MGETNDEEENEDRNNMCKEREMVKWGTSKRKFLYINLTRDSSLFFMLFTVPSTGGF
jgi:hypothetical protein